MVNEVRNDVDAVPTEPSTESNPTTHREKFIVTYAKKDYDIIDFLDKHPAGRAILEKFKDKDITDEFDDVGHSDYAKKLMQKYRIQPATAATSEPAANEASTTKTRVVQDFNLAFILRKLVTKEDEYFVHKSFGVLALISYVYRYLYVYPTTGTLGFNGSWFDYATLFVHFMLSFTSLIFHVLRHRILDKALIIYEEYRLHAILFTGRAVFVSLFAMIMTKYQNYFEIDNLTRNCILIAVLVLVHLSVDWVTMKYGTKGVTAVRINNGEDLKWVKLFFSYYQIAALGSHLIWSPRICDLGFNALVAIQSSAFLMTLRRKSIIRWYWHLIWYSVALILSYYYMWVERGSMFFLYTGIAFMLRTQFNLNKYVLWTAYVATIYYFDIKA